MKDEECYFIYILECSNNKYYTGYTQDLKKRYSEHLSGKAGAKFTRGFKPLRIAQAWKLADTKGTALKIESLIKRMDRKEKDILIKNPKKLKEYVNSGMNQKIKIIPQQT